MAVNEFASELARYTNVRVLARREVSVRRSGVVISNPTSNPASNPTMNRHIKPARFHRRLSRQQGRGSSRALSVHPKILFDPRGGHANKKAGGLAPAFHLGQ